MNMNKSIIPIKKIKITDYKNNITMGTYKFYISIL